MDDMVTADVYLTPVPSLLSLCLSSRLAGYVEALASRLGMQIPDLSPKQADMWQTRVSSHSVCTVLSLSCRSFSYQLNKH